MIVLDASAVIELLMRTATGASVERRIADADESLHAPHLMSVEVSQVLRRLVLDRTLSPRRAHQALEDLADLPVDRYAHEPLLERMWALRSNLTAYDATYVALSEALDAPLLTADRRLAAAPGHRARIELVADPG